MAPASPSTPQTLPVLPLTDTVVLPGMVVPIELDAEAQAAIDAAQTARSAAGRSDGTGTPAAEVLLVPRLDGTYSPHGTLATIEQVGRLPGGQPAAVVRGVVRARIGSGVNGPGPALWIEATATPDSPADERTRELAKEYRALVVSILQQRDAWQLVDGIQRITEPGALADTAGYAPYLDVRQKALLLAETDVAARLEQLTTWAREHLAEPQVAQKISSDVREGMERQQRDFLLRQQLGAIRKELGELNGTTGPEDGAEGYRARVEAADLPEAVRAALTVHVESDVAAVVALALEPVAAPQQVPLAA